MENKTVVTAVAKLRGCQMSARKMRLVADIVRGVPVEKAFGILKYTRKEAARWMDKVLKSAVSNWMGMTSEDPDEYGLKIQAVWVDQGSQLKRFRPAPHGRAHRIRKHTCHVTIQVANALPLPAETKTRPADEVTLEDVTQD